MMAILETFRPLLFLFLFLKCGSSTGVSKSIILGLFPGGDGVNSGELGVVKFTSNKKAVVRLVGIGLDLANLEVLLTPSKEKCTGGKTTESFPIHTTSNNSAILDVNLDILEVGTDPLYLCLLSTGQTTWEHQGDDPWLSMQVTVHEEDQFLPLWMMIVICGVLLILSGLFSGLNLGLMSLDQTELEIIQRVGSPIEKKHAQRIFPLRKRGNFLLCTLLLGNVMVNSSFTILYENLTNGLIAVISSTIGIVIFGEIIPQAICSRHGLAVGAKTFWITKFFMFMTFPLSFPISLILDKILGEEMGQVFNKEKLMELIRMTADQRVLHDNEANIMSGALQLTNKSVQDVMTNIDDVFMLEVNTELDFETLTEIMRHGYTRVPVYEKEITNIVNLLNTKELALIDPDDKTQLRTVCRFYDHKPLYVDFDLKLDVMLQEFLQSNCHMAIVQKLHSTDNKDPYFENIGVITLEDVIEEILQSEIIDETDRIADNREKKPLNKKSNYGLYSSEGNHSKLPHQLEFVAFQFLASNVECFSENSLNRNVLKNLMKKNIAYNLTPTKTDSDKNYIFKRGQPADKFVLILQGTVEVTIGKENMVFESGPFSYYGSEFINGLKRMSTNDLKRVSDYTPDFSVRALTPVQYLCIGRRQYMAALRVTRMLRSQRQSIDDNRVDDQFDVEFAKLSDKNDSNSLITDFSSPPNLPLEALKYDESPQRMSTSSLDRGLSLTRRHDSLTRMKRSGSDAKDRSVDSSPVLDNRRNRTSHSESSENEVKFGAANGKDSTKSDYSTPGLTSQTSLPFTPLIQSDVVTGGGSGSAQVWPEEDAAAHAFKAAGAGRCDQAGDSKLRVDLSARDDSLEKVPLVEIKKSSPNADGNDNPGMAKKMDSCGDPETVPLMQQPEKSGSDPKDSSPSS